MSAQVAASKRKVFVVDDHPIVRSGLAQLINREPDLTVCGDADKMQTALETIDALKPDILIVDISLKGSTVQVTEMTLASGAASSLRAA